MTVFDEMKVASEYWEGYKPALVDEACRRGNDLEEKVKVDLKDRRRITSNICTTAIVIAIATVTIFFFAKIGANFEKGRRVGYEQARIENVVEGSFQFQHRNGYYEMDIRKK